MPMICFSHQDMNRPFQAASSLTDGAIELLAQSTASIFGYDLVVQVESVFD